MMQYTITTSFKVVMNSKTGNLIYPERGIRQGHPVSLYIFIIFVEYPGRHIHFAFMQPKSDIGLKLDKECPNISYLCLLIIV